MPIFISLLHRRKLAWDGEIWLRGWHSFMSWTFCSLDLSASISTNMYPGWSVRSRPFELIQGKRRIHHH